MNPSKPTDPFRQAFPQELSRLGWVEGRNIAIDWRSAHGRYAELPDVAAQLARSEVDVIVVATTPGTRAVRDATKTIPVVFTLVSDPVASGFVSSLRRPGGNVTGISAMTAEAQGKRLELLKEAVPEALRVGAFVNPATSYSPLLVEETKRAARSLGVGLHVIEVRGPDDFEGAFSTLMSARADALLVIADSMFYRHRTQLASLAARHGLPTMHGTLPEVKAGGLMAYAPNFSDLFRRAATYIDKILKGANPADLPVEQPKTFDLIVNLGTAKALGLTIPESVLVRADEVIE